MDADTDSSTDADSDADTDTDTDTDSDSDSEVIPEVEEKFDYRIPVSSGGYVFIPDRANDKLIVVNSETLNIQIVEVGATPTHVVPLGDDGRVAVLAVDSDEVSIVAVDAQGTITSSEIEVRQDTNALVPSADGRFVIAFWDSLFEDESPSPETNQDISIIDTSAGKIRVYDTVVGMNPISVSYNNDTSRAFVITETGIDIIDLENLSDSFIPDAIKLFDEPFIDPDLVEVAIDATGTIAMGRRDDSVDVSVAWLDGTDEKRIYTLPAAPTDLDLSVDGTWGMLALRATSQVAVFALPLPASATDFPFELVSLGGLVCGTATLLNDGSGAALYTTVEGTADDRRLITILSRDGAAWNTASQLLTRAIKSVEASPDSTSLFVMHNSELYDDMPWSYSLVKLPKLQTKFQQLEEEPGQLLMTPQGDHAFLIVTDGFTLKRIDIINLGSFIVDSLNLGSVPTALGYATQTDKVFVSQDHPSGRMTFVDMADDSVKTVTGYALNNEITN